MELAPLKTDKTAKLKGRPFAFGDGQLIIAASGNVEHRKALRRLYEPHAKVLAAGGQPEPEAVIAVDDEAMAEAILVGWENITVNGEALPYSKANALMLLRDYDAVREVVMKACESSAQFTVAAVEAATAVLKKS